MYLSLRAKRSNPRLIMRDHWPYPRGNCFLTGAPAMTNIRAPFMEY